MINAKVINIDGEEAYIQFTEVDLFHQFKEGAGLMEDQITKVSRVSSIPTDEFLIVGEEMLDATDDVLDFATEVSNGLDTMWES